MGKEGFVLVFGNKLVSLCASKGQQAQEISSSKTQVTVNEMNFKAAEIERVI